MELNVESSSHDNGLGGRSRRLPSALEAMNRSLKAGRAESKAETSNGLNKVEEQEGELSGVSLSLALRGLEQS